MKLWTGYICLSAGTKSSAIMNLRGGVHKFSKYMGGGHFKILGTARGDVK